MSVLFADIRSFSRISERLAPHEIIDFLVKFLTPMTDLLLGHKATIDKYIGDAILAFWNAPLDDPDHHVNAARAALAMQRAVERPQRRDDRARRRRLAGRGQDRDRPQFGAVLRRQYRLGAAPVLLADRRPGEPRLAARRPDQILWRVDPDRRCSCRRNCTGSRSCRSTGCGSSGATRPEAVHVLLGDETLHASPEFTAFAAAHRAMLDAYFAQDWGKAADAQRPQRGGRRDISG